MKKLRLLAILFAGSLFFASCTEDETMNEILNDADLEQPMSDDEDNTPPPPPSNPPGNG